MKLKDIIAVGLLIIVTLLGFTQASLNPHFCKSDTSCLNKIINQTGNTSLCKLANKTDTCYISQAVKQNKNLCDKINKQNLKNRCYQTLSYNNKSYCLQHQTPDKCFYNTALKNKNPEICESAANAKYCLYSYAYHTKNLSLCNQTGKYKQKCIELVRNQATDKS